MSCSCNCSPCSCSPQPVTCCNPTAETVVYAFENQGLSGVGVFDNETDYLVGFRTIVSESLSLTVTLDAPNKTIVLDFDDTQLVADLPDATTAQRGILETATDPEAVAKALNNKILTPSNLAALGGTTSFAGFLELATNAETITGTDTARATTPAGVAAAAALYKTVTFADAATRAAAVPSFNGQFGSQTDAELGYMAGNAGIAGDWLPLLTLGSTNISSGTASTVIQLNGDSIQFDAVSGAGGGGVLIQGGTTTFYDSAVLNFEATSRLYDNNVIVPANSVLTTSSTAGQFNSSLISTFLSSANTQVYGMPSGTLARTTFATYGGQTISNPPTQAEVQAIDDAVVILSQRLGAVITDMMNTLKPHAT